MVTELIRWLLFPAAAGISGIYAVAMARPVHRPKHALKRGSQRYPEKRRLRIQGLDLAVRPRHLFVGTR